MSEENKPDPAQAFQNLLGKHNNDAMQLASRLFDENYQYRNEIRTLKEKVPADGSIVLVGDDAKRWNAFCELKADPKEIKKSLECVAQLETDNKELSRMELLREASAANGYKTTVLKDLLNRFPSAEITFKEEKDAKTNQVRKVPHVSLDGKESSLEEFANQNFADYLPALKADGGQPPKPGNGGDPAPRGGGESFFDRIRSSVKQEASKPVNLREIAGRSA